MSQDAAVKIQSIARGNQDRQRAQSLRCELAATSEAKDATTIAAEMIQQDKVKTRARVLDQAQRKKDIEAELVADLLEKGGVGACLNILQFRPNVFLLILFWGDFNTRNLQYLSFVETDCASVCLHP